MDGVGCTQAILKAGFIVGWCIWFARQGVDITCLLSLEPKLKSNCQVTSLMGTREQNNPKQHRKGLEAMSVPGRREGPSSSELLWNNCTAEEVGRSTDQVAGVQMGTGEMLRASLQQIPAFLSRENNQEFGS